LREACGRLLELFGVIFMRMDIGRGYGTIKLYRALILEASGEPERHCEKNIGVIVSLARILKSADSVFCISPKF
jgi:hypothetical protein